MYTILLAVFSSTSLFLVFDKNKPDYLFVLRVFIAFEYAIFIFFISLLSKNKVFIKIILFSIVPFWSYCIYNFFISKPDSFNNYPALVEFSVFILIILFYFYEKMKVVKSIPLLKTISFWLIIGMFIFFTGNLFFLLFIPLAKDKVFIQQMLLVYSGVTITKNLILAFAWFAKEQVELEADIIQIPENMDFYNDFSSTKVTNT